MRAPESTLIFGTKQEAGSSPARTISLETRQERKIQRREWLLYYTGLTCKWNVASRTRDAISRWPKSSALMPTCDVPSSATHPAPMQDFTLPRICIGQPGVDDLESCSPRKTAYDLVEVSRGRLRGLIPNLDPHNNSEIRPLKHHAWTYWGHSGASPVRLSDGTSGGLHSSWDESTAMKHGVPVVAIRAFLEANLPDRPAGPVHLPTDLAGQFLRLMLSLSTVLSDLVTLGSFTTFRPKDS